jgi:hypothetical protein
LRTLVSWSFDLVYFHKKIQGIGMLCPLTLPLPRVLNPSRLTYLIKLIKLFFTCTFILYSTLLFSVLKIKFKIGMRTKVAVSSVIDGGRKLEYHSLQNMLIGYWDI